MKPINRAIALRIAMNYFQMPTLEQISPSNAMTFKTVRLMALQDSPSAFGSTYANEAKLSDADWLKRATQWSGSNSAGFLAMDGEIGCGIAGCFLNRDDALQACVISMWVSPARRRHGVGGQLIDAIIAWAGSLGAKTLQLTVTSNNQGAIEFYRRNGFSMTGTTEPYPNDPTLIEFEMIRAIGKSSL